MEGGTDTGTIALLGSILVGLAGFTGYVLRTMINQQISRIATLEAREDAILRPTAEAIKPLPDLVRAQASSLAAILKHLEDQGGILDDMRITMARMSARQGAT